MAKSQSVTFQAEPDKVWGAVVKLVNAAGYAVSETNAAAKKKKRGQASFLAQEMVDRLNRMLRGWADYFREGGEEKRTGLVSCRPRGEFVS